MSSDPIAFALSTPGHLQFSSTRTLAESFDKVDGYVETRSTGHLVFYGPDRRRFLATDPTGHPLHECEWEVSATGTVRLARARVRLDWGRWVGIKPGGLVNETRLNLAAKPHWQRVTPDDLRAVAASALRVPIEEVRWFYRDEDFAIDPTGMATIRQRKDALYILEDGTFDTARFMSCMGVMHWDQIDFLPVVELFKSLLPGTGSAVFELIRGLYDDQNKGQVATRPLRYRGIPTYPSEAAFHLFSNFFTPQSLRGRDPFADFLNPATSHILTWLPAPHPPVRYFDESQGLCLTVKDGVIQKATLAKDPAGLSYVNPIGRRVIPLDRSLSVQGNQLILKDRERQEIALLKTGFSMGEVCPPGTVLSPVDWRTVFVQGVENVRPGEVYEAVPLYPEDDTEIGELAAQPFVADYLDDLGERDREIGRLRSRADRVLIVNGDAVISTCVLFDRPRDYMVSVRHMAYAQRQAQQIWTQCAEIGRWEWLQRLRMTPTNTYEERIGSGGPYDLMYQWLPYDIFGAASTMGTSVMKLCYLLRRGGEAFIVGPEELRDLLTHARLELRWDESVASLPTFRMHKTILSNARLKTGLTLFHIKRP